MYLFIFGRYPDVPFFGQHVYHTQTIRESTLCPQDNFDGWDTSGGGGGVLRFGLDRGVPLEPRNPYPLLRVIVAGKGTHFGEFLVKIGQFFHNFCQKFWIFLKNGPMFRDIL